jgi:predicted dehydrogenase/threonine dehydrogenase-like Zn-dependent dehydrogenase
VKQIVQEIGTGVTRLADVPAPRCGPAQVLLSVRASLISAGTERYVVDLAKASLIEKARRRPDQVRRVLEKIRTEGLRNTVEQVRAKLDDAMPLGYSAAGVVLECGASVHEFKPGDRVAARSPHAACSVVGRNLCARIPEGVSFEAAAYTSVAAIGMEGVRLARVTLGESVLIIGLGLIGQISVALFRAQGCRVFGTDIDPAKVLRARELGADAAEVGSPADMVKAFSRGFGVDAVVITAATTSNEPIEFAAAACRPKGRIVLVGVVGLNIPRPPFFEKELEFTVSSGLGPGRNDAAYEEKGIDYPIAYARWTAQRNMEACLDLMAAGKLPVEMLTTHRFPIDRALEAYDLVTSGRESHHGIVLDYPKTHGAPVRRMNFSSHAAKGGPLGLSLVGAGNFARLVLIPSLKATGGFQWRGICTAKGLSAEHAASRTGFAFATTDFDEVLADPGTSAVLIATRHDEHAGMVRRALEAGKHVFVEKPLCITPDELADIAECLDALGDAAPMLMVGFNRRFAPATARLREHFRGVTPLSISYRFAAGPIPPEHWTQDLEVGGGRIVGEACHAIDTCIAIAGSTPVKVYAESVSPLVSGRTSDDCVFISIRHANGSVSSVSYQAGGDKAFPGERIEVFGGGLAGTIEQWDEIGLWSHGRRQKVSGGKDKGHRAELAAFLSAVRGGGSWPIPWEDIRGTTWASLAAVQSLRHGAPVHLDLNVGFNALRHKD